MSDLQHQIDELKRRLDGLDAGDITNPDTRFIGAEFISPAAEVTSVDPESAEFTGWANGARGYTKLGKKWIALAAALGTLKFGILNSDGSVYTSGDYLNINFWASLGLPSNSITRINTILKLGNRIWVGGVFTKIGGVAAINIAYYDTTTGVWYGDSVGANGEVFYMTVVSQAASSIYVGGAFTSIGGVAANRVAILDDVLLTYSALGTGLNGDVNGIYLTGGDAYVTGAFTTAGGSAANYIALYSGGSWSALGSGLNLDGNAITGDGTNIYVTGDFTTPAAYVAKWNGSAWSALGDSITQIGYCIELNGTDLYVGGAGNTLDKWDGTSWTTVATASNDIHDIAFIGTDLYICGKFTSVTGTDGVVVSANRIAMMAGDVWSALGDGLNNSCYAMAADGSDLYVGGIFTTAGSRASKYIAAYYSTLSSVLTYLEVFGQAFQDSTLNQPIVLDNITATQEVVNTTTETDVWTYTIPGNKLGTDGLIELDFDLSYLNNSGVVRNLTIRVYFGGTAVTIFSDSPAAGAARRLFRGKLRLIGTGSATQNYEAQITQNSITSAVQVATEFIVSTEGTWAIDQTANQILKISVQHAAAAATISAIKKHVKLTYTPAI